MKFYIGEFYIIYKYSNHYLLHQRDVAYKIWENFTAE